MWKSLVPFAIGAGLDFLGQKEASDTQSDIAYRNAEMQREFAQQGVRWRVEDARAAGVSPLVALGAQTHSFAPSMVGDTSSGSAMASMGQNIMRAVDSTRTQSEREEKALELRLENQSLQNDLLRLQIQNASNPPFPEVDNDPLRKIVSGDTLGRDPSAINDSAFVQTPTGLAIVPAKDVKERIEDQWVPETMWAIRNHLNPALFGPIKPSLDKFPLPKGMDWVWSPVNHEFRPMRRSVREDAMRSTEWE